jgi:hypothetical protein
MHFQDRRLGTPVGSDPRAERAGTGCSRRRSAPPAKSVPIVVRSRRRTAILCSCARIGGSTPCPPPPRLRVGPPSRAARADQMLQDGNTHAECPGRMPRALERSAARSFAARQVAAGSAVATSGVGSGTTRHRTSDARAHGTGRPSRCDDPPRAKPKAAPLPDHTVFREHSDEIERFAKASLITHGRHALEGVAGSRISDVNLTCRTAGVVGTWTPISGCVLDTMLVEQPEGPWRAGDLSAGAGQWRLGEWLPQTRLQPLA